MKRNKLTKIICSTLAIVSALMLNPISANAEWKKDDIGWWYHDENSNFEYVSGWNKIDGKWYYFTTKSIYEKCHLVTNAVVDGYTVGSDGAWIESIPVIKTTPAIANESDFEFNPTTGTIIKYNGTLTGYNNSIIIPNEINGVEVKEIGQSCFSGHDELIEVTISDGIKTIADGSFNGCFNLKKVDIPKTVTTIYFGAFSGNENLTNVVVPNSVTSIGEYVFDGCPNLKTLTIPKALQLSDEKLVGSYYLKDIKIIRE